MHWSKYNHFTGTIMAGGRNYYWPMSLIKYSSFQYLNINMYGILMDVQIWNLQNMKVFWYLKMLKSGFFTFVSFSSLVMVLTSGITPLSRSKATFNCFILSLSFAFAVFLRYFVIRAARELKVFWPFWGRICSQFFGISLELWNMTVNASQSIKKGPSFVH